MNKNKVLKKTSSFWVVVSIIALSGSAIGNPVLPPGVWVNITPPGLYDPTPHNPPFGCMDMKCLTQDPNTLYITTDSEGMWKSTDGGSSWTKIGSGSLGSTPSPGVIQIDPNNPLHMYNIGGVRGTSLGFWVSTDGGNTWAQPAGFTAQANNSVGGWVNDVYEVAAQPNNFNHVLLSFHSGFEGTGNAGILESKDGGNTWIRHYPVSFTGNGHTVWFLKNDSLTTWSSNIWLVGTQYDGYWRTTDSGNTWTQVSSILMQHGGVSIYYSKTGVLYIGAVSRIMRSTDNGKSYTQVGPNISDGYYAVAGDGTTMFAQGANTGYSAFGPYHWIVSPESDGTVWTNYNSTTYLDGPYRMTFDAQNRIFYSANWNGGVWAMKAPDANSQGITITNLLVNPAGLTNNISRNVTFTLKTRCASGTITNVSLNLSQLGGAMSVKMANISGNTLFSYTASVPAGLSVGTKSVPILAWGSLGSVENTHSFSPVIIPYFTGIVVTNITATPSSASNNRATMVVFDVKAKDLNGSITNVSLNLASLGGPALVKMNNISGATLWEYSQMVAAGLPLGLKSIVIQAIDNSGNVDVSKSVIVNVINGWQRVGKAIYTDITNRLTSNWTNGNGAATPHHLVQNNDATAYEGTLYYRYDYSIYNGWDGFGMNVTWNSAGSLDITGATNLQIAYKFPPAGSQSINFQIVSYTNNGHGAGYSSVVTLPPTTTWKLTNIPVSAFTNGHGPFDARFFAGFQFNIGGATSGTGSFYFDDIVFYGVNVTNTGPVSSGIGLTGVSASPALITNNKNNVVTLSCVAMDSNGSIASVTVDLSQVGGTASFPLTNIGGNNWRGSYTVGAGVSAGTKSLPVKAIDNQANSVTVNASITVSLPPPSGIVVTNISVAPAALTNNLARVVTINVTAKDTLGGSITNVSLNLSSLSGPASVKMTNISGGTQYRYSYTVPSGLVTGAKTVSVKAWDNDGNSDSLHNAVVNVVGVGINGISIQNTVCAPAVITNNKANTVVISCVAFDSNGTINSLTLDLSAVGGSASKVMTNIGGNNWRCSTVVPSGTSSGSKTIAINAVDNQANGRSVNVLLNVANPPVNGIGFTGQPIVTSAITNGKPSVVTVSCVVMDSNGTIAGVTVDLSGLGGPSAFALTNIGGNNWRCTYTVGAGIQAGSKTLVITAIDNQANTRTELATLTVTQKQDESDLNTFRISPNPLILSGPRMNGPLMTATYNVNADDEVSIEVYTILGELVKQLKGQGGSSSVTWDAKNMEGKVVSSGMYLVFMRVNGKIAGKPVKFGVLK